MPIWSELLAGFRLPDVAEGEPGECQHIGQYWSSSVTDASFRKLTLLFGRIASSWAHVRFHSVRNAGAGALPHRSGIHNLTSSLENAAVRKIAPAISNHGGIV